MELIKGNIFNTKHQTIVNTVNCFGVMGAGIALECKYRYPDMFIKYKEICDKGLFDIGKLYLYKSESRWILNFPTKYHWKFDTKPEYIIKGFKKLDRTYKEKGIKSIAFPLLGAQNGGLSREESLSLMDEYTKGLKIPFEVYEYDPKCSDDLFESFKLSFIKLDVPALMGMLKLNVSKIKSIKELIEREEINNMNQLASSKGIGEATMKKCFEFAMNPSSGKIQLSLF